MTEHMTPERLAEMQVVKGVRSYADDLAINELIAEIKRLRHVDNLATDWGNKLDERNAQLATFKKRLTAAEAICERVAKMDSFRDDELVIKWKETLQQ